MKALNPRRFYTFYFFLGCLCLFAQFAWADGGRSNPYINQVEIIQTDRQDSMGGIMQSTTVKVMLNSFGGSLKDRIIHMKMRDTDGVVYDFDHNDFYSAESGDFYSKEFPFFLDSEIIVTIRDLTGSAYDFTIQPFADKTLSSSSYDGNWTGTTNQGYEVSFTVNNNMVTPFKITREISGSNCTTTKTTTTDTSQGIIENSFSYHLLTYGPYGGEDTFTGTFVSDTKCNGTWDSTDNNCNGSGSGTWTADNNTPPPTTTTTSTTTTTTTTSTTTTTLPECADCPSDGVITNVTYAAGTNCSCTNATSISIGSGVTIESGANITFKAPTVKIQSGFHAEEGSVVNIKQQ